MVNKFFQTGTAFLFRRQSTIISAAIIMMSLVMASRVLGLVRNRLLAHFFPIETLDAYKAAFVLPDFLANILITGALSVSFIPVFTAYLNKNNQKEGWKVASTILNISLLFYGLIAILLVIFAEPVISRFVVPGFSETKLELTTQLTVILLLGQLFLIIGSFFTSVLQSYHRFIIPALAPVLYNVGVIIGIVWFRPFAGLLGVGWGVVIGAILHILIQAFLIRKLGFEYKFQLKIFDSGVLKIIKLSVPRALAIGLAQAEWWVSVFLTSLLVSGGFVGSVAVLGFAADIQNLPIGLFGITFATAALPTLSGEWAAGRLNDFKATFLATLHQILYLTVPLSVLFMVLRIPVVRIMLGTGFFDWDSTVATAVTTSYFAIGIFAQAGFFLLIRAFYALHDAATPLKVAFASLIFHSIISAVLVLFFSDLFSIPVAFLGLAFSFTGIFSFFTLLFLLDRKVGGFNKNELFIPAIKIFLSAALMGILLYIPLHIKFGSQYLIDHIIDTTRAFNLLMLTSAAFIAGIAIYIFLTWWLRSQELNTFLKLLPDFSKMNKYLSVQEKVDPGTPE